MSSTKVAYITGGTKGIGRGIAEKMLSKGIHVAISGRTEETVKSVAKDLSEQYQLEVLAIESDVRSKDDEISAMQTVLAKWGRIDYVIANAGVGHFKSIEEISYQEWQETIDVNLTGVFHTTKAFMPSLIESKGYLITIASLAGANFFAKGSAYNASKFGLVGFTQAVMLDVRDKGVKVSTIMPGSVATNFNGREIKEADSWKIQPEDIGQLVVDLIAMDPRVLPSKVEVRPSIPQKK